MTSLQLDALEFVTAYGERADAAAPAVGTWLGTAEELQALAALAKMGSRARQVIRARIDGLPVSETARICELAAALPPSDRVIGV